MNEWRKKARRYLALASEIVPKLPTKNDNALTVAVKLLAIVDSLDRKLVGNHALSTFFDKVDAKSRRNALFVDLFYSTDFQDSFEVSRMSLGEYTDVVIAEDKELGSLYFVEYLWGAKPEPSDEFWHSTDFDLKRALEHLWKLYNNGIHISMKTVYGKERPFNQYRPIIFTEDPLVGTAVERLQATVDRHRSYVAKGFSRTYLFVGKQGVGKSTFANRMSQMCGKRTLRIDARGMTLSGANDLSFLLGVLAPDFLILDDIDRVTETAAAIPAMLEALSDLKERHPTVAVILTANNLSAFDPAIIRPGRIDKILKFEDPNAEERRLLLEGYLGEYKVTCDDLSALAEATEGLTAAYLKEVVITLASGGTQEEMLETIKYMREYTDKKPEAQAPNESAPKTPPPS